MVVGISKIMNKMMNIKRVLWLIIIFIWVLLSIDDAKIILHNGDNGRISIDKDHKIAYKTYYIPLHLSNIGSFISIGPQEDICKEYVKNGIIDLKYEYDGKIYSVGKYNSFEMDESFKYKKPIKIILEAKKDIVKCNFNVIIYPGKIDIPINGIIFFWLPIFLVYKTILLPIVKYIFGKIKFKILSLRQNNK